MVSVNYTCAVPGRGVPARYVFVKDGIPYKLNAPYDFSFLSKYGKVFKVFDEQGSGNIAFGTIKNGKRYFIKFAGAPKPNYIAHLDSGKIDAESAIKFLKAAVFVGSTMYV